MTNEYKEIEDNSHSNSSITTESLCSECKNEIAADQNQDENRTNNKSFCSLCRSEVVADETPNGGILMKFFHEKIVCSKCKNKTGAYENHNSEDIDKNDSDSNKLINELIEEFLDDNEEILQATQSLSQISLGHRVQSEQNQSKNLVDLDEPNGSSNGININENDDNHKGNNFFLYDYQDDVINTIEVGEENLSFEACDENAIDIILENLNSEQGNKFFCDQEVQTENENSNKENETVWDPEFPSGAELEKIDNAVREATITSVSKCKRKLNFDDIDSNFKVAKRSKDVSKPNVNAMVSIKLNREKYLADLANDLYVLSSYLYDIGEASNAKEFNNKTPMKIPAAPKIVGYDMQFDGLNQSRYSKLPINIENIDSNKFNSSNESFNSKQRVKTSSRKISNGALTLKNAKITNNNRGVGLPKKNFYQTTLKEAFNYGKENKNSQHSSTDSKKSINKAHPINNTKNNGNDKSLDSTSMYDFNPLRSSTVIKKN